MNNELYESFSNNDLIDIINVYVDEVRTALGDAKIQSENGCAMGTAIACGNAANSFAHLQSAWNALIKVKYTQEK